jgi:hypothetical protein
LLHEFASAFLQGVLLCIEHNPRAWQTQSDRKAVLLGTQKKSGISGHPKEKRYLIRKSQATQST